MNAVSAQYFPLDAPNAYPEPVGTLDKLEHSDGALWVHLNGKRSKLIGLQSLSFLISTLQAVQHQVFGVVSATSWLDMATAPKTNTLVLLLVRFRDNPTDDQEVCVTIGANALSDTGHDSWQFAGWDWEQDCFRDGEGEPIGWLPLPAAAPGHTDQASAREVERLREECEELNELVKRQAALLSEVAIVLRGPEPPLTRYSHSDIPSRVKAVVDQLTELKNTHNRGVAALNTLADRLRAHNDQMASGVDAVRLAAARKEQGLED
ncbi:MULTISPECIES: hypothetical protein [Pseudomonas]|uniref:hypothetical protein n=1 Tax=Pseudomonas TaxID=286 RepID=UPI003A8BF67F